MQNKSQVAGILTIISGAIGILLLAGAFLASDFVKPMSSSYLYSSTPPEFLNLMNVMYLTYRVVGAILGIFGITGGIFALRKRHWGWALTGAITGVITFLPTGIAAIILMSLGRDEFQPRNPALAKKQP